MILSQRDGLQQPLPVKLKIRKVWQSKNIKETSSKYFKLKKMQLFTLGLIMKIFPKGIPTLR